MYLIIRFDLKEKTIDLTSLTPLLSGNHIFLFVIIRDTRIHNGPGSTQGEDTDRPYGIRLRTRSELRDRMEPWSRSKRFGG